jgi:hypothetical protein
MREGNTGTISTNSGAHACGQLKTGPLRYKSFDARHRSTDNTAYHNEVERCSDAIANTTSRIHYPHSLSRRPSKLATGSE